MSKKKSYYLETYEDCIFDTELVDFCYDLEQYIKKLAVNMLDVPYHLRKKDTKITYINSLANLIKHHIS